MSTDNDIFEQQFAEDNYYKLRLFVAGTSPASVRAIKNLGEILETQLPDKYELEIIDIHQQPELVQQENIAAVPTLIKKEPNPKRLLVGDMSDTVKVLRGLGLYNESA